MSDVLDTVLLLALPASGKSEVRRYLAQLPGEVCRRDLHLGPTVQLDDFPYVHLMRRIDEELERQGHPRQFFHAADRPFQDTRDWGTLIHLLNEDYQDLVAKRVARPDSAAGLLLRRIDAAARKTGLDARLAALLPEVQAALCDRLEPEAAELLAEKHAGYPESLEGRTLVIEFARGGPQGADMPLPGEHGYRYSLAQLLPAILERAVILYIWVTPEESRRKNDARANPDDPGSILHHGVPIEVMLNDYGCDDMTWLEKTSGKPGTVSIRADGREFHLPVARFDNRVDKTSFIRNDPADWQPAQKAALHAGLSRALDELYAATRSA